MNPVFTLNYPELLVASYLQKHFPSGSGFSVHLPLSAQQKGYDLALMQRTPTGAKVITFQVKSSRTFTGSPGIAPRSGMRNFRHYMWLKAFKVLSEADFFVLIGQYALSQQARSTQPICGSRTYSSSLSQRWRHSCLRFAKGHRTSRMATSGSASTMRVTYSGHVGTRSRNIQTTQATCLLRVTPWCKPHCKRRCAVRPNPSLKRRGPTAGHAPRPVVFSAPRGRLSAPP